MANATNRYGFTPFGNAPEVIWRHAAASQGIAKGDAVILNAAGDVNIALAASAALYGIAAASVTTTAANEQTLFPIYPFKIGQRFIGQCSGSMSAALRGDFVDIEGATGAMQVDEDAGATKVIQILNEYTEGGDELGANCQVIFTCVKSQFEGTEV